MLIARRALFSTVVVASLVAVIVWAASAKRAMMNMVVHAYDLFFYLSSWSTVSYMWSDQRRYVVGLIAACFAMLLVSWLAYRVDSTRIPRRWAVLLLVAFVSLAWYGAYSKGERRHMQFYYSNLYVSSFYASWGETIEALWRGALLEAAPAGGSTPLHYSVAVRHGGQAAAHHPDPSGVGGAAVAVPDAALRPLGRPVLPVRRRRACTSCVWRPTAARRG